MKEEIYTIPVNDGFKEDCECAFCAMERKLEQDSLDFVLSPSYMEEDVRDATNEKGFCRVHMDALYKRDNALGVALIVQTHLMHQRKTVLNLVNGKAPKKGLFGKKKEADPVDDYIRNQQANCYVCSKIDDVINRYFGAFFILWKRDEEFRKTVLNSKGFCMHHFLMLYQSAQTHLSGKNLEEFMEQMTRLMTENLDRVADDINWFTLKFDYRYKNEPWKNSKDAVPRTIQKVNSQFVSK